MFFAFVKAAKKDLRVLSNATQTPDVFIAPVVDTPVQAPERDLHWEGRVAGADIESESRLPVIFRHSGWQRERALVAASLERTEQTFARRQEFKHCGNFAYVVQSVDDPEIFRIAGSCCRDRFCLPCATERSSVIANNVAELIDGTDLRFITFTIKTHAEPLTWQLDKLYKSFQAIRRRAYWKTRVRGGVAFLELKWSERGQRWHPHLHCLVQGHWMDKKILQQTWHKITGDSFVVDIRRPPNIAMVIRYVTKYASKPFNSTYVDDEELLDEAMLALHGRKLCVTYGTWRGVCLTAIPSDGTWETVGSLDSILQRAAYGDVACLAIMAKLTTRDLTSLYARAPPRVITKPTLPKPDRQDSWFGTWQHDGTFRYPAD